MPGRDAYLDGLLGNLDSPVLGGVERRNIRLEHAPLHREFNRRPQLPQAGAVSFGPRAELI